MIAIFSESFEPNLLGQETGSFTGKDFTSCKLSWCRELACHDLLQQQKLVTRGTTVTLVGVYYDCDGASYQPKQPKIVPSKAAIVGNWLQPLFTWIIDALNTIFETDEEVSFHLFGGITDKEEDEYTLHADHIGVIRNIPATWLESKAVTSFLLYLIRIWGKLIDDPLFPEVSSRVAHKENPALGREMLSTNAHSWRDHLSKYCLPFWFMQYGKKTFWTFLYTLHMGIENPKEVYSVLVGSEHGFISGFTSFYRYSIRTPDAPQWFHHAAAHIAAVGLTGLVTLLEVDV